MDGNTRVNVNRDNEIREEETGSARVEAAQYSSDLTLTVRCVQEQTIRNNRTSRFSDAFLLPIRVAPSSNVTKDPGKCRCSVSS